MAGAALAVAIVSALGAVAAVWVAVWTQPQQGSRIECVWSNAYPVYGAELGEHRIQVQAINHGRSAATIAGWGLEIINAQGKRTDSTIVAFQLPPWQPQLPYRLDSESSAGWMMAFDSCERPSPAAGYSAWPSRLRSNWYRSPYLFSETRRSTCAWRCVIATCCGLGDPAPPGPLLLALLSTTEGRPGVQRPR